jgi:hypothetical protein
MSTLQPLLPFNPSSPDRPEDCPAISDDGEACSRRATFGAGFILAVFISPSAFFFVTRALRIGVYSGGTPCQGSR